MPLSPPTPVQATDQDHLRRLVDAAVQRYGPRCDLNHIDVSQVATFNKVFAYSKFNGDLSQWHLPRLRADYCTRMVPGTFAGVLPHIGDDFDGRKGFYRSILKARHGAKGLDAYLVEHPFNAMHLDMALNSSKKPPGVTDDDMRWVQQVKDAAQALGLDQEARWEYALSSFNERGMEANVLSLDFSIGSEGLFHA